jgi:hypothetical protein
LQATAMIRLTALLISMSLGSAAFAQAPSRPARSEIWTLKIGAPITDQPDDFVDFACGTIGGPPSITLRGWADFKRCRAEDSGLREVYFRYDDEMEYWARANNLPGEIDRYGGTKTYGFPIVTSGLISDDGILRGIRIVSDPRYDTNRDEAYILKNFLTARFGREGWTCADLPREEGETAVDGVYVKQQCGKDMGDGSAATMWVRHLRKAGQSRVDPRSGKPTLNQFESIVRFDLVALAR